MLKPLAMRANCPICKAPVTWADNPYRPFCSPRCKTIDLGGWLEGDYRITRPLEEEDLDESPRITRSEGTPED